MHITVSNIVTLNAKTLGEAMADMPPDEFAAMWLAFGCKIRDNKEIGEAKLDAFAEVMASDHGRNRLIVFEMLLQNVHFHIEANRRNATDRD